MASSASYSCIQVIDLPLKTVNENKEKKIRECFVDIGKKVSDYNHGKVIMLVGAKGAGKSTLINGLVNYALGVEWKHPYRRRLIREERQSDDTKSQTEWITSYVIHCKEVEESPFKYPLTIIDTPGFIDSEGIERDQRLLEQIQAFFSIKGPSRIDEIHAIGFVIPSGVGRLTPTQKYVFQSIMSVLGKDVQSNVFLLTTFADSKTPSVINAVEGAGFTYHKFFKFNNSALFEDNSSGGESHDINEMFWKIAAKNNKNFFSEIEKIEPKSLGCTRQVLEERQHLEECIESLQQHIHTGLKLSDEDIYMNAIMSRIEKSCLKLEDIELKPNPLTDVADIDLLIQSERQAAQPDYQKRIEQLERAKEKAELLTKIKQGKLN